MELPILAVYIGGFITLVITKSSLVDYDRGMCMVIVELGYGSVSVILSHKKP
ncbi:hypothetical protein BDV26DRAFT_268737 [Aspergillus bertholletiae]|uniref:Uncharacterized protein n=1 Tax=Aspergillus bertholletiae TaxID=1226010 RepID=A0A5N7B060_9EURO|nr:hypothetical protein BDV26DRAFT_268737 [Aspergillus bertholletiae]